MRPHADVIGHERLIEPAVDLWDSYTRLASEREVATKFPAAEKP